MGRNERPRATVEVAVHRRHRGVRSAEVRRDACRLLARLKAAGELSVVLTGDEEIRRLNAAYRGKDSPTDVLSFPAGTDPGGHPPVLGDVVISVETAARQAAERSVPLREEVRFLLVHGVLHLLGYDHERSREEARRMFRLQRRLLRVLQSEEERGGDAGAGAGRAS